MIADLIASVGRARRVLERCEAHGVHPDTERYRDLLALADSLVERGVELEGVLADATAFKTFDALHHARALLGGPDLRKHHKDCKLFGDGRMECHPDCSAPAGA